jgi:hypothetical protein
MPDLRVVPYREGDDTARLRAEIDGLRAQLARLRGAGALLPFESACPKCGSQRGPDPVYRPRVSLLWGRWVWPEHMQRKCFHCGATWRTRTLDGSAP